MSGAPPPFAQRLKRALASPDLPAALERTLSERRDRRAQALAEVDFPSLRADLTARRQHAVDHLPDLIERFTAEARAMGARVHCAADAAEARAIVVAIAREHGVRLAVTDQAMTLEEIELAPYLAQHAIPTIAADLLACAIEPPDDTSDSTTAPNSARRRLQLAALSNQLLAERLDPHDSAEALASACGRLRQQVIDAGMAISGADLAIAESGRVVLRDASDTRAAVSLPQVQVVLLGIDQIVPAPNDARAVLTLLAASGSEQLRSNDGASTAAGRLAGDEPASRTAHGAPVALHVVLIDNGRTGMLADPACREALRCVGCDACSEVCPSLAAVGGAAFGYIYSGPIGLVLTAWQNGVEAAAGPQSLCVSCNACEPACPVTIPLPRLILDLREQANSGKAQPLALRAGLRALYGGGPLLSPSRLLPLKHGDGFIGRPLLPGGDRRQLPRAAEKSFMDQLARREREGAVLARRQPPIVGAGAGGLRVAYFPGCITDRFYPEIGIATVRLLQAAGAEVVVPPQTGCCGLPAYSAGDRARASELAQATIAALRPARVDYVVSSSSSCAACIGRDYAHILRGDAAWQRRAGELAPRVIDLTRFLDRFARFPAGSLQARAPRAAFHDACQSCNRLGLREQPRRLASTVAGGEIAELDGSSGCCGFGGVVPFAHPDVARRIAERRLLQIERTGAPLVLTDDPGCIVQLRGALHARGSGVRVQHLAEYLADALPAGKG